MHTTRPMDCTGLHRVS